MTPLFTAGQTVYIFDAPATPAWIPAQILKVLRRCHGVFWYEVTVNGYNYPRRFSEDALCRRKPDNGVRL